MLSINGIIWISIEFIYWLIIARVFLSWIPVNISYTIKRLIYNLTDPLLDLFRKIIDEAKMYNLPAVNLNGLGEPITHPRLVDMIQYCKVRVVI